MTVQRQKPGGHHAAGGLPAVRHQTVEHRGGLLVEELEDCHHALLEQKPQQIRRLVGLQPRDERGDPLVAHGRQDLLDLRLRQTGEDLAGAVMGEQHVGERLALGRGEHPQDLDHVRGVHPIQQTAHVVQSTETHEAPDDAREGATTARGRGDLRLSLWRGHASPGP